MKYTYKTRKPYKRQSTRRVAKAARRIAQYSRIQLKVVLQNSMAIGAGGEYTQQMTHALNAWYIYQTYCPGYIALKALYDEIKLNSCRAKVQYISCSAALEAPAPAVMSLAWDRDGLDPSDVTSPWTVKSASMAKINITGYEGLKQKRIDLSNLTQFADPVYASIYANGLGEKTQYVDMDATMSYAMQETVAGLTPTLLVNINTQPSTLAGATTLVYNAEFTFDFTVKSVRAQTDIGYKAAEAVKFETPLGQKPKLVTQSE